MLPRLEDCIYGGLMFSKLNIKCAIGSFTSGANVWRLYEFKYKVPLS